MPIRAMNVSAQDKSGHEGFPPIDREKGILDSFCVRKLRLNILRLGPTAFGGLNLQLVGRDNMPKWSAAVFLPYLCIVISHDVLVLLSSLQKLNLAAAYCGLQENFGLCRLSLFRHIKRIIVPRQHSLMLCTQFSGENEAQHVQEIFEERIQRFLNLRLLSLVLDKAKESVVRCRVVRYSGLQRAIKSLEMFEAFKGIAAKRAGVYVVQLRDGACDVHTLVLDSNYGVIIDSEESCELVLSNELLEICGDIDVKNLRVHDVRMIKSRD